MQYRDSKQGNRGQEKREEMLLAPACLEEKQCWAVITGLGFRSLEPSFSVQSWTSCSMGRASTFPRYKRGGLGRGSGPIS